MKAFSDDDRKQMIKALKRYCSEELEADMGDLKAELMLQFLIKLIGHASYNCGIEDAQAYLQGRLLDMEIDLQQEVKFETE